MKKTLHFICLFLILFIGQVNYVKADTTIASGTIANSEISWELTSADGTQNNLKLSLTGTGDIPNFGLSSMPWYNYRSEITSASIASGITSIGQLTFYKTNITSIDIPSTCTTIGSFAFIYCSQLKALYIPSSVTSIASSAFGGCSSLNLIYFEGRCTANTGIEFSNVASNGVFLEKEGSGTSYAHVPSGWEYITHDGSAIACIADGTLYVIGRGEYNVQSSSASWYSDRSSIKKIVVEKGITNIGTDAFSGCSNVTEVTLNNKGVIGSGAFKDCTSLTRVNIGTEVTGFTSASSSTRPFYNCSKLATINVEDFKSFNAISNLYYLTDSDYGTAAGKILLINGEEHPSTDELVIPEGVTEINHDAIAPFKNVTKIRIPSTVTAIKENNFRDSRYLTEITVPQTVGNVVNNAFKGCTGLQTATLNNNGYIGNYAFDGCTGLQTITLNNNGYIGHYAFDGCTGLQTVTLNNSGSVGYGAFKNCTSLTRVNIGTGVTKFQDYANSNYPFKGCSKLSIINISDYASFNAIEHVSYLTSGYFGTSEGKTLMVNGTAHNADNTFYIPEGITTYNNELKDFDNVEKVCLPSTMTTVSGFREHRSLTNVTLSSSVTSVVADAFSGCTTLKSIVCLSTTVPSITGITGVIAPNPGDIKLRVPKGCKSLYEAADVWKDFDIEEADKKNFKVVLYANGNTSINYPGLSGKEIVWSNTDPSAAQLITNENGRYIVACDFTTYDGSTSIPYRATTITATLDNGDIWQWNVTVNPKEVILTDGNAYKNTEDHVVDKISYTRSFSKAGAWQPIYMPFAIDVEAYKSEFDIAEIYAMCPTKDTNGNGVIDSDDDKVIIVTALNEGYTIPNAPYLLKPKTAKEYTIEANNSVLKAAEINVLEFSTAKYQYQVSGIYDADFYVEPGDNNFYMTSGGGFSFAKTKKANIKPNRWVLHEEAKGYYGSSASNSDSKMSNFTIEVLGEDIDETTAIKLINGETISVDSKNNSAYNLNGMKVDATKSLPSGIYIINGKKVFKK